MKNLITVQEREILRSMGEELNEMRKTRKLTYAELAQRSGFCLQHVFKVLQGNCADFATMARIAYAMDASFWLVDNRKIYGEGARTK